MERPHPGRRRHNAGSITVADLLDRERMPHGAEAAEPDRPADPATTVPNLFEHFIGELTVEAEQPPEPHHGWMATTAKVTGLAVGSLVLCGSVLAAAALTHGHRAAASDATPSDTVLTGVNALRPDELAAQLADRERPTTSGSGPRAVAHGRATGTIVGTTPHPALAQPQPQAATDGPQGTQDSAESVVRSFYSLVASQPDAAAQLVDPSLLASDPAGFAQSWSDTSQVDVESTKAMPDGSVQAVINLRQPDGELLRVVELLHVTLGDNPVINGAELLSAQRG